MTQTANGKGQTALVTGASYGIGLDLAECFAQDGYNLILTARSAAALETEAQRLAAKYGAVDERRANWVITASATTSAS